MNWFRKPRRRVPEPESVTAPRPQNPYFPDRSSGLRKFRRVVLITTAAVLVLIGIGLVIYGPWLRITQVTVLGTEKVDSQSLEEASAAYLSDYRSIILPNRNLWLLSRRGMAAHLRSLIEQRLAIDEIQVQKIYPHTLRVIIQERQAVATWQSDSLLATLDRRGKIIEYVAKPILGRPFIFDENQAPTRLDQAVISQVVRQAVQELYEVISIHQLPIDHFIIPVPVCPDLSPQNGNVNQDTANTNSKPAQPELTGLNVNQDRTSQLANSPVCDLAKLRFDSPEIHFQLTDGPRVLFDRRQNLSQAVAVLQRLLLNPDNQKASYIDLRFGERVYIR